MASKKPPTSPATQATTPAPPKRRKSGPSGPTQSPAQRAAAGRVRVELWLDDDVAEMLTTLAQGTTRKDAIQAAIRLAFASRK